MSVIEIKNLYFSYNGVPILDDINMDLPERAFLALIGPNGGGKTTLLKIILGLLKPMSGEVRVFGETPARVVKRLGYVPQGSDLNKDFPISVMDVVLMGRLGKKAFGWGYSKEDVSLANDMLDRFNISDYKNERIGEISGGQRRRAFIARALVSEPEILFLDEPLSSIDIDGHNQMYEVLRELNKDITIVMATHDIGAVSRYIKSIACVNRRLYYHDTPKISDKIMSQAYGKHMSVVSHDVKYTMLKAHKKDKSD